MWKKIKNWLFPKQEEFVYRTLIQAEPERKVTVVKKASAKKPAASKKAPAKKTPAVKKTVKKSTPKKKK